MNTSDNQLERLLQAASGASAQPGMTPPFGMETRVLAAWRSSRGSGVTWDSAVLVRGLAVAALLLVASIWPVVEQSTNSDSENLQLADSSVPSDLTP